MPHRDYTPLILAWLLLSGVVILALLRHGRVPDLWRERAINWDDVLIGLYLLWIVLEKRISKRDASLSGKHCADGGTCPVYAASQALTVLCALWFTPQWHAPNVMHAVGFMLFLAGVGYRWWAIRTLGEFYSYRVRSLDQQRIVTGGPYRFTRHPAYAGMILAHVGICLYFFSVASLASLFGALIPAILLRIAVEEKSLFEMPGYAAFARDRKRLIPGLW